MEREKIDLLISRKSIKVRGYEIFTAHKINSSRTRARPTKAKQLIEPSEPGQLPHDPADSSTTTVADLDAHCYRVYCKDNITLPARSETIISAKMGKISQSIKNQLEGREVVAEPEEVKIHGIYVARSLCKIKNSSCVLKILNCSSEEIVLKRNTALGTLKEPGDLNHHKQSGKHHTVFHSKLDHKIDPSLAEIVNEKLAHLNPEYKSKFENVIYEFKDLFSIEGSGNLGCTSAVTHKIDTGNAAPIKKRPYRIPHALKPVVDDLIKTQLDEGVIVPSSSPWNSPLIILPKKIGPDNIQRWRCVVDFRAVNEVTTPVNYVIPDIRESLDKLGGSQFFTSLDMNQGFYQIKMDPDSAEKTAFSVPDGEYVGTYQYDRMPLGLRNAPSTFQRFMDTILVGLRGKSCLIYLDDCLIYGSNIDEHIKDLRDVLLRFQEVNLSVKLQKCKFAMQEVEYLGHHLSPAGIKPLKSKVEVIEKYPQPTCVRDVRGFLGLTGYYRRHILGYSELAKPLTLLTKKNSRFEWSETCEVAFQKLKQALISEPLLVYPDFSKPFVLSTDASLISVGAILANVIDGQEHPICYASRQLSKSEQNYSVTEREVLAVIWAVKVFRCYLTGVHFTLVTDHSAIKWLLTLKDHSSRLTRWALKLAQYNYTVVHKPGKQHLNADALSRVVLKNTADLVPAIDLDSIRQEQRRDEECQKLKEQAAFKTSPQGIIYYGSGETKQILVPSKLRERIMQLHHDIPTAGHAATLKTLERIKQRFIWPKIKDDVREYVKRCHSCSQRRDYGKAIAPLGKFEEPTEVFQRISCDMVGPLPLTSSGNRYVLSIVDHFSRYTQFFAVPDQTSETVARVLVHRYITRYGTPSEIITDQGGSFTSALIQEMCKLLKIKKLQTTGYHPMSNGRTEITHKTLGKMLSHYVNKYQNDWDEYLSFVCMAYNSQYHEALGFSPYEIVFGRKMQTPLEGNLSLTDSTERYSEHVETLRYKLSEIKDVTRRYQENSRRKQKNQYDKKSTSRKYHVGQRVYLYVPQIRRHRVKKLSKLWKGPYRIVKVISELNVTLRIRNRDVVVHVNRIKPVSERRSESQEQETVSVSESEDAAQTEVEQPAGLITESSPLPGTADAAPVTVPAPPPPLPTPAAQPTLDRPRRARKMPTRLQDFEMDY